MRWFGEPPRGPMKTRSQTPTTLELASPAVVRLCLGAFFVVWGGGFCAGAVALAGDAPLPMTLLFGALGGAGVAAGAGFLLARHRVRVSASGVELRWRVFRERSVVVAAGDVAGVEVFVVEGVDSDDSGHRFAVYDHFVRVVRRDGSAVDVERAENAPAATARRDDVARLLGV